MNLPSTLPEFEVTFVYTTTKRIRAATLTEAERTARLIISDGRAKLHSVIQIQEPKDGKATA